jgi:hypothetical protein
MIAAEFLTMAGDSLLKLELSQVPEVDEMISIEQESYVIRRREWHYVDPLGKDEEVFGRRPAIKQSVQIYVVHCFTTHP